MQSHDSKKKVRYKVKNWSEYNRSLINRGNITFWFSEDIVDKWYHAGPATRGAQKVYSDMAIGISLIIRSVFTLRLRSLQGFMEGLREITGLDIDIPNYTTVCRRQAGIRVGRNYPKNVHGDINVILDSTGLKVFGEGEWKVRRHGYTKRRMWRKLHIASTSEGEIVAELLTTNSVTDSDAGVRMLDGLENIGRCLGDKGYDQKKIYEKCADKNIRAVIPPQANARIRLDEDCKTAWRLRNKNIRAIRRKGFDRWSKDTGYGKRSIGENVFYRYKKYFGDKPLAHKLENQMTEVNLKCAILNTFMKFGKPISYAVA